MYFSLEEDLSQVLNHLHIYLLFVRKCFFTPESDSGHFSASSTVLHLPFFKLGKQQQQQKMNSCEIPTTTQYLA